MIWFLHGALGVPETWQDAIEVFQAAGHSCTAVDLYESLARENLSLEEWAKGFNREVAAAGFAENVLVGYSMGGRLALHALLDEQALWSSAVMVSAHPGLQSEDEKFRRMVGDAEWAALVLTEDWSQFLHKWDNQAVLQKFSEGRDESDLREALASHRHAVARSFTNWSLGKQRDLRPELGLLTLPVLWLSGGRDEKFCQLAREAFSRLGNAEHEVLPSAGHRLHLDTPEEFQAAVLIFLSGLASES